jgi:hypothetical protein
MTVALWLLAIQGLLGAFDTLYYHEWRARLPARPNAAPELKLHAARDCLYAVLFGTLPLLAWQGLWLALLGAIIVAEIVVTLTDFMVEATVRKPMGDVAPGERVTHGMMGIVYGAMLANLAPVLGAWWWAPSALTFQPAPIPASLRWSLLAMAAGVFVSGARDLYSALGLPYGSWPWELPAAGTSKGSR